jgi:hypothetical protein
MLASQTKKMQKTLDMYVKSSDAKDVTVQSLVTTVQKLAAKVDEY